jgi:hypothetical protein
VTRPFEARESDDRDAVNQSQLVKRLKTCNRNVPERHPVNLGSDEREGVADAGDFEQSLDLRRTRGHLQPIAVSS